MQHFNCDTPALALASCSCSAEARSEMPVQLLSDTDAVALGLMERILHSPDLAIRPGFDDEVVCLPPTMTMKQRSLRDKLEIPKSSPGSSSEAPESREAKDQMLLKKYREFTLELHAGKFLTQFTANQDYTDVHCQLTDDLETLKLDEHNGCIVEFPLSAVAKMIHIVKNDNRWHGAGLEMSDVLPPCSEHLVIVDFQHRKLVFVFAEDREANRFMTCMQLLVRRSQQRNVSEKKPKAFPAACGIALRAGTPP